MFVLLRSSGNADACVWTLSCANAVAEGWDDKIKCLFFTFFFGGGGIVTTVKFLVTI